MVSKTWAKFAGVVLVAALLHAGMPGGALASENWKIVVPYPPGGSNDLAARMLAEKFRQSAGATVIVENLPGANGNIGAAAVARATPDGMTMLLTSDGYTTVNPILFKDSMKFDPADLYPVSILGYQPTLLVVNANSGIRSLADLISKSRGGQVSYSSGGIGSAGHLTMGYFGKLLPLAVSSSKRLPQLPDVPTIAESGYPGFEVNLAAVLLVPSRTPANTKARLATLARESVAGQEFQAFLDTNGFVPAGTSPEEAASWIQREKLRWSNLIQKRGIVDQ